MLSKGMISTMEDLGKEFAAGTGCIITGMSFRQTVTGWQLIVKRVNKERVKEVLFLDGWTVNECLELLYNVIHVGDLADKWKVDKF